MTDHRPDSHNPQVQIPRHSRLLYVVGQLELGGLERQLYYLLANLDHARYEPAVVVWNLNPKDKYYRDIEALNIPIYGFPPASSSWSKLRALRTLVRQVMPEVVHSYGFPTNFAAYYSAWGTRSLAIGALQSEFALAMKKGGAFRGVLNGRWPPVHISNSVACAESAQRNSGFFVARQYLVVRNGLDLNSFQVSNEPWDRRMYVAGVGSLVPVKRWDRLLRVVQQIKNKDVGEIRFRIAGGGPLRSSLEALASDLGVSQAVEFLGPIQDVPELLRKAKFLVHTSESEGTPNALLEAMASGLPVVAMQTGEIPYLVEEGTTGFTVRQGDETTFVKRVSLLLGDRDLCIGMGLNARTKAEREFRLERLVSETLEAYKAAGWKG